MTLQCGYCHKASEISLSCKESLHKGKHMRVRMCGGKGLYWIYIDVDGLQGETVRIKYCPMCGRKLEEG